MGVGGGVQFLRHEPYCVPLSIGWELKPTFYFLQILSPYFFIRLQWAERAKI